MEKRRRLAQPHPHPVPCLRRVSGPSITGTVSALRMVGSQVNHQEQSALSRKVGPELIFHTHL